MVPPPLLRAQSTRCCPSRLFSPSWGSGIAPRFSTIYAAPLVLPFDFTHSWPARPSSLYVFHAFLTLFLSFKPRGQAANYLLCVFCLVPLYCFNTSSPLTSFTLYEVLVCCFYAQYSIHRTYFLIAGSVRHSLHLTTTWCGNSLGRSLLPPRCLPTLTSFFSSHFWSH